MIAALSLPSAQWHEGKQHELSFWNQFFSTNGWLWPQELAALLDPQRPLQASVRACLEVENRQDVSLLDVGAGPLTKLGKVWPGHSVRITAIDPLAAQYRAYLDQSGLTPLVETQPGEAEHLDRQYDPETFDLAYCVNALDHSYDPLSGILQMLRVVKTGGFVVLEHGTNEAVRQNYEGMHQWNFANEAGEFIIWNKAYRINVGIVLAGQAEIILPPMADPAEWIEVRIRKLPL